MKLLVIISSLALITAACSGGNPRKRSNELCTQKWAPATIDNPNAKEKVDASESSKSIAMTEGVYQAQPIRVYMFDQSEDIRLDLTIYPDRFNEKSGSPFTINCVGGRGLKPSMDTLSIEIPYITTVNVDGSGSSRVEMAALTLEVASKLRPQYIYVESSSAVKTSKTLKDAFEVGANAKHMIYKLGDTSYESRVQYLSAGRREKSKDGRSLTVRMDQGYQIKIEDAPAENARGE